MTTYAPLSRQQAEVVRNMRNHPDCIHRYDSITLFRLNGPIDRDMLNAAVADLMDRHAALRTVLAPGGTNLEQRIQPVPAAPLECRTGGAGPDQITAQLIAERHGTAEVMTGAPLFRARLYDDRHLSFTIHHLVYDGWSLALLWRDLGHLYAARVENRPADLPQVEWSYADFAWEQATAPQDLLNDAIGFWREILGDCPRGVMWPRPGVQVHHPQKQLDRVPAGPVEAPELAAAARQHRVSTAAFLLAVTAAGVARVTGQRRVLFGTDTANREDRRKQNVVGHFVNSRFALVDAAPGRTVPELARQIWRQWGAAERFREVYSDDILQPLGGPPVFKVNMPTGALDRAMNLTLAGAPATPLPVRPPIADWRPIHVVWNDDDRGVGASLNYQVAGIDRSAIRDLSQQLEKFLADPQATL